MLQRSVVPKIVDPVVKDTTEGNTKIIIERSKSNSWQCSV